MTDSMQDEFGDPIEEGKELVHQSGVVETEDAVEVGFKFPKGTDPTIISQAMTMVGKMTAERMKSKTLLEKARESYKENGHRRFRCQVDSLRDGIKYFDLIIPHPDTDKPCKVFGQCGVIIEDGLTQYTIDCLTNAYSIKSEEDPNLDPNSNMALTHRTFRVPNFRVQVFNEITNPKRCGSIGRERPKPAQAIA